MQIWAYSAGRLDWKVDGRIPYDGKILQRAVASRQGRKLNIYLQGSEVHSPRTLMDLIVDICGMLLIPADRWILVHFIMGQDDPATIEQLLMDKGIPILQESLPDLFTLGESLFRMGGCSCGFMVNVSFG